MDTSPEKYVKRLSELIDKKSGLLREIQSLTLEQSGVISEEGMDGLQGLIDAKQARIDAINKLDEEFQVYFVRLKSTLKIESLSQLDASGIAGAEDLKTKVAGILEQIEAISALE